MLTTFRILSCTLFISLLAHGNLVSQKLKLGSLFKEHMVLQREMPVKVWGEAIPHSHVIVILNGDSASVKVNMDGTWETTLPKQKAGGPYTFKIKSGSETIQFNDVLIGEVWVCSGQSNMFMGYHQIPEIKALDSILNNIRTFKVENTVAFKEQKYVGGKWEIKNPPSAVAFTFAYFLQKSIHMPVGIILTSWGSSSIEGWMPRDMTEKLPHFKNIMKKFDADGNKKVRIDSILSISGARNRKDDIFLRTQPNIIYNAMMKPLAPYACRGLVWYQGEANSNGMNNMIQYGTTLPMWVERIRHEWQKDDLQFMAVMLPGFGSKLHKKSKSDEILESPTAPSWAWIRESQCQVLTLPHTAVATTIDLGDKNNIHPSDKLPIGQRLALLAQKNTFNKSIMAEGPILKKTLVKKNRIVIHYTNAKGLKTTDGEDPSAFWLSDDTNTWYRASAKIKGKTVVLTCDKISKPLYVRYAFAAMPKVNLINDTNLPARPFRTDVFEPVTVNYK
ncbi:sialate O-acetylesterase [Saccharicrinis sp. 156]|uniref:sialate O-acetylesterase n=1 Tax=Saccharicrinis sp. 156 TaxID=3417574 RepID=UPI003D33F62F